MDGWIGARDSACRAEGSRGPTDEFNSPVVYISVENSKRVSTMAAGASPSLPFVGRGETVEVLHRQLEDARSGAGGVTLLLGEAGVGKSALLSEIARDARARGARVLWGRAPALDSPPPFSLIRSAFQSAQGDSMPAAGSPAPLGTMQILIGFAPGVGDPDPAVPGDVDSWLIEALSGTQGRGGMLREQALAGVVAHFLEFSQHAPTVLVLEDVSQADSPSLEVVETLAREVENRPFWILATSRLHSELAEAGRVVLERFEGSTRARTVLLPPLTSREVAEFLHVNDPTREFTSQEVARFHSETGGNPLLLQQLDRWISAHGSRNERRGEGLPPLDEDAQRVLEVAAVLGPEFPFGALLRTSGEEEERLAEAVDRLVGQGLLFESPGELLAFPEARLRKRVYDDLPDARRRLLHRRAGEALETSGATGLATTYALARHFYLGGADEKSVRYNTVAAEMAKRGLAPEVALEHFGCALESQRKLSPKDLGRESKLVLELSRVNYELGRLEAAERILQEFLQAGGGGPGLAPRLQATFEILLTQVLTARGDLPAAVALAERILASPELEGDRLVRIGAYHQLGLALYYQGHYPESLEHHTEELRLARELGNDRVIAHALTWHSGVLAMLGRADQALAEAREVASMLDRTGSAADSAQGHLFLGNMLADNRSTSAIREEAILELKAAIRWGVEAQDPRRVGWAFYHTAELLREEGRLEEAAEQAEWAAEALARIGDRAGQSVALKVRGQIAMAHRDYARSEADLLEAHRLLQGLKQTVYEIDVVLRLAQLSAGRGDRAGARKYVVELERLKLSDARPDLVGEFRQLQDSLASV